MVWQCKSIGMSICSIQHLIKLKHGSCHTHTVSLSHMLIQTRCHSSLKYHSLNKYNKEIVIPTEM